MHPYHPQKPFVLPTDWTAEQAFAVVDLLDELREHLWAKYQGPLLDAYREQYATQAAQDDTGLPDDDALF
jgi:hypothetical protein